LSSTRRAGSTLASVFEDCGAELFFGGAHRSFVGIEDVDSDSRAADIDGCRLRFPAYVPPWNHHGELGVGAQWCGSGSITRRTSSRLNQRFVMAFPRFGTMLPIGTALSANVFFLIGNALGIRRTERFGAGLVVVAGRCDDFEVVGCRLMTPP